MSGIKYELKKQGFVVPLLCVILPLLINLVIATSLSTRYEGYLLPHKAGFGLTNWQLIFKEQTILYFSEILYIVAAVLVYNLYKIELKDNAWTMVASTEYRNNKVILNKFATTMFDVLIYLIVNYICLLFIGCIQLNVGPIETGMIIKAFGIQFISCMFIVAFYFLVISFFRKIKSVLVVGTVMAILDISLYYKDNPGIALKLPITFISQCYKATMSSMGYISVVGVCLTILCLLGGVVIFRNKYNIEE